MEFEEGRRNFKTDVAAKISWFLTHRNAEWIRRFRTDLADARELLSALPQTGITRGKGQTRRLLLRKTPFVLLYVLDDEEVMLLRLFHGRQEQELPPVKPQSPRTRS